MVNNYLEVYFSISLEKQKELVGFLQVLFEVTANTQDPKNISLVVKRKPQ